MSASTSDQDVDHKCKICHVVAGKYVCPRCNMLYCSVTCYRSKEHADCSEEFYRKCVQEELVATGSETSNPERMLNILQQLQQAGGQAEEEEEEEDIDSDDDTQTDDLADRLAGVNLDDADVVWQRLTPQEKQDFHRLLSSGDASHVVPEWQPWWTYKMDTKLVQDLDATVDLSFMKLCPELNEEIPPLDHHARAHPAIRHCIENAVLGYAVMARHYAGDHVEMCGEAATLLLQLSTSLGKGENFHEHETAIAAVTLLATQDAGLPKESIELGKQDLQDIMRGPGPDFPNFYLHSALSDCITLLLNAAQLANKPSVSSDVKKGEFTQKFSESSSNTKLSKKQITLAIKKLQFYVAWTLAKK